MKSKVAILIISHKEQLLPFEKISLKQGLKIFKAYPVYFICPEGLEVHEYHELGDSFTMDFIPAKWQSNYKNFNRLKIDPFLYKRYSQYDYILFYEPDAFVFRDELHHWVNKGYDYIGAPWLKGFGIADENAPFLGVGNGGFSLRKVSSALKALRKFSYIKKPSQLIAEYITSNQAGFNFIRGSLKVARDLTIKNNTFAPFNNYPYEEDHFWSVHVNKNFDWFRIPPPEEALSFSMEVQPRKMYELNNQKLPFGCHAWWKYDLDFWRPFIEAEGFDLSPFLES
jgi:hypothetical protein